MTGVPPQFSYFPSLDVKAAKLYGGCIVADIAQRSKIFVLLVKRLRNLQAAATNVHRQRL
jgi:hypothetical protein